MSSSEWDGIISAIKEQFGKPSDVSISTDMEISDAELAALRTPADRGRFSGNLPTIDFERGLSDSEIKAVEERFSFRFPPDLRTFLQTALPCGEGFPNWRSGKKSALRDWLDLPRQGVLFDVRANDFWLEEWGPRPDNRAEAERIVRELIAGAPKLIPVFSHRMMPDEPHLPGNPVFSVHQTDIIVYGFDLADYLRAEFNLPGREPCPETVRPIRFWDFERFQEVRWGDDDGVITDPSTLPDEIVHPEYQNQQARRRSKWWQFWRG